MVHDIIWSSYEVEPVSISAMQGFLQGAAGVRPGVLRDRQKMALLVRTIWMTLPETNIFRPWSHGWLEYDPFLLGPLGLFSGAKMLVSGRVKYRPCSAG